MRSNLAFSACFTALGCAGCATASADALTPLRAERGVQVWLWTLPCQSDVLNQFESTRSCEPVFMNEAIDLECPAAHGRCDARQSSRITATTLTCEAASAVDCAQDGGHLYAGGRSSFDVSYRIEFPTAFTLSAVLEGVQAAAPAIRAEATVTLADSNGDVRIAEALYPPADGIAYAVPVLHNGSLPAGEYRLQVQSEAWLDAGFPPARSATTGLRVRFDIAHECGADLTGDGLVNLEDLAVLLADFGCADGGCAGDVNGDLATDVVDLERLLTDFGRTCAR